MINDTPMKTKLISIVTAFAIYSSSVTIAHANFWDNNSLVFSNFTRGASATDPSSGTAFFSGGAAEIRFLRSTSYSPLFHIDPPGVRLDCRGMSFNGGFLALLNIEQLGEQLKNAGASLAWGIAIGLAYSLPALKQVFDEINKWANWLSKFLADMCNFGKLKGKEMAQGINKDLEGVLDPIMNTISSPKTMLSVNDAAKALGLGLKEDKLTSVDIDNSANLIIEKIIQSAQGGVMSSYLTNLANSGAEAGIPFVAIADPKTASYRTVELHEMGLSNSSLLAVFSMHYLMVYDVALSFAGEQTLSRLTNFTDDDKGTQLIESIEDIEFMDLSIYRKLDSESREPKAIQKVINFMLYGGEADWLDDKTAPSFVTVAKKFPNGSTQKAVFLSSSDNSLTAKKYSEVFGSWDGLLYASKSTIMELVNKKVKTLSNQPYTPPATHSVPIMDPIIFSYVRDYILTKGKRQFNNIVATLPTTNSIDSSNNKIQVTGDSHFSKMLNNLAALNSYLIISDIAVAMQDIILKNQHKGITQSTIAGETSGTLKMRMALNSGSTSGEQKVGVILKAIESLNELKEKAQAEIDNIKNDNTLKQLVDDLKRENKERK